MNFLPKANRPVRYCVAASALAASLTLAAGCENAVEVNGKVTVPVDVQQLFSAEQPGVVMYWGTKVGGGGALRYLCAPQQEALVLPYRINKFGCVQEQSIEAWAFRVRPDQIGSVRCDDPDVASPQAGGLRGEELAYGASTIFPGENDGPCSSGSDTADVTMALGKAP